MYRKRKEDGRKDDRLPLYSGITQMDLDDTRLLYQLHLAKVPLLLFQEKSMILL